MGDEIPRLARILHVADAFEAMTAARPYRMTPLTPEQALAELRKFGGIQFDPDVVDAFIRTKWARDLADPGGDEAAPGAAHRRRRPAAAEPPRPAPDRLAPPPPMIPALGVLLGLVLGLAVGGRLDNLVGHPAALAAGPGRGGGRALRRWRPDGLRRHPAGHSAVAGAGDLHLPGLDAAGQPQPAGPDRGRPRHHRPTASPSSSTAASCRSGSPAWPPPASTPTAVHSNFHTLLPEPVDASFFAHARPAGGRHPIPHPALRLGRLHRRPAAGRRAGLLPCSRCGSVAGARPGGSVRSLPRPRACRRVGRASRPGRSPPLRPPGHQRRLLGHVAGPDRQLAGGSGAPDRAGLPGGARHQLLAAGAGPGLRRHDRPHLRGGPASPGRWSIAGIASGRWSARTWLRAGLVALIPAAAAAAHRPGLRAGAAARGLLVLLPARPNGRPAARGSGRGPAHGQLGDVGGGHGQRPGGLRPGRPVRGLPGRRPVAGVLAGFGQLPRLGGAGRGRGHSAPGAAGRRGRPSARTWSPAGGSCAARRSCSPPRSRRPSRSTDSGR